MGTMSVEVPEIDQLLAMTSPARYGDELPDEGGRGGALHLSSVLPAISSAIGHPIPTAIHADPKRLQEALGLPDARSAVVVLVDGLGYWNINMRLGHSPYLRSLMADGVNQRPIATCMPSTTVAAMSTFGTGAAQSRQWRNLPAHLFQKRARTAETATAADHIRTIGGTGRSRHQFGTAEIRVLRVDSGGVTWQRLHLQ